MKREKDVIRQILYYLQCRNIKAWRNQSGMIAIPQAGRRTRVIRMGMPGLSDISGILTVRGIGVTICIEAKSQSGRQRDTQKTFQDEVERVGAFYCVVREIEDLERFLIHVEREALQRMRNGISR